MDDRLYRSVDDRMLAGVAGGVAERLDADPSIIRVVWALLIVLTGGLALVAYIVMAIVVPEAPLGDPAGPAPDDAWAPAATDPAPDPDAPTAATAFAATGTPAVATEATPAPADPTSPSPAPAAPGAAGSWVSPSGQTVARASGPPPSRRRRSGADRRDDRGPIIGGVVLILIGAFFLLRQFIPAIDLGTWWPLILVGIGALLVVMSVMPDRKSG